MTRRGITLLEVLIVVSTLLIIVGILFRHLYGHDSAALEEEAKAFARKGGLQIVGVSCMDIDSDHDGYVSCTLFFPQNQTKGIECAAGRGCRLAKDVFNN